MAAVSDTLITILEVRDSTFGSGMRKAGTALDAYRLKLEQTQARQQLLGTGAGVAAGLIAGGIIKSVQAAGRMEQISTSFRTIEGSVQAAGARIKELQEFDRNSPFDFEQTVAGARRLRAMGVEGAKLIPIMKAAGDAVSAQGGSNEQFGRALLAIGQIQTKGRVTQEELNQLYEAGALSSDTLTKELGLTAEQLRNVGDAGIPAAKFMDAYIKASNRKFGGAMEAQSKTLAGSISNLNSSLFQLGAAVGAPLVGPIGVATRLLTGLTDAVNGLPEPVKDVIGVIGVGMVGALALVAVKSTIAAYQTAKLIPLLVEEAAAHYGAANAANAHAAANARVAGSGGTTAVAPSGAGTGGMSTGAKVVTGLTIAAVLAELGLSFLPEKGRQRDLKMTAMGAVGGASLGAVGGGALLAPFGAAPVGALIGGIGGAAVGGAMGHAGYINSEKEAKADKAKTVAEQQLEETKKQTALLEALQKGKLLDPGTVPVAAQIGAIMQARVFA